MVHHLCQNTWHASVQYEPATIARYCRLHDKLYPLMFREQAQAEVPIQNAKGDIFYSSESEDEDDSAGIAVSTADADAVADADADVDADVVVNDVENANNDAATDDVVDITEDKNVDIADDDQEDEDDDEYDSGDDRSEAELLDEGVEFGSDDQDIIDDVYGVDFVPSLPGAPDNWTPPGPPEGWTYKAPAGSPLEEEIDNPGKWNLYSYAPKMNNKTKEYVGHFTPSGATVVPEDENGDRVVGGWKFYYTGWTPDAFDKSTYVRGDAVYNNLKPESRRGSLDKDVLVKHGLTKERMMNRDALFFYQLLFPIADPKTSGVELDGRMPYFTYVAVCTNVYAMTAGVGAGIGHSWVTTSAPELVRWTSCPIRNGAMDGRPSTLPARWKTDDARFDPLIYDAMSYSRWRSIKRFFKLNNNLTDTKKKGDDGYDPCRKYDFIYKVLVHNMNYVTNSADLDATVDESTWGFGGYSGDCGQRLMNKPVSRGKFVCQLYMHTPIVTNINTLLFIGCIQAAR